MLALKAALWALVAPGTVDVVVPAILIASKAGPLDLGPWRWLGLPLIAIGAPVLVWCVVNFAREGRGTLAPIDPPKFVVRGGPYRWVRNPMYLANVTIITGEALLFESWAVAAWGAFMAVAFHLFVVFYEEPTLTRRFGAAYEEYRRTVPQWLPRIK
ncbi:MAG TPA: isoprenylcysteine carboxylmethyltransferase family protein [Planctomycetota bacterium]|nr:isoprenylcysteine carboxylmethyltransferase family protein [Planctomycetota bacterium]